MKAACKMITKKLGRCILMFCLFLIVAVSVCIAWGTEAKADSRTIRVGYIDYKGFIENINGNYSGYGVDYLEKIAEYTGWKYEYVYDTWENCLERLQQGEIDLVCTAQYTEARARRFAYAQMPLGYESTILYVREDSDIYYNDLEAMNGCSVGLLQESFQTAEFAVYAEEHDLEYEPCYYATEQEIVDALKNGDVDMIAVGSLARHTNVKAVGRYGAEAFYCMTGKNNEALVAEIDEVLKQIRIDEPGLETELTQKYYGIGQISSSPLFTREENDYIQQAEPIRVCLMNDLVPLSYEKDGEYAGVFVDYLNLISEKSGLKFVIDMNTALEDIEEQMDGIVEENYLMLRPKRTLEYFHDEENILTSNTLFESELAYVARKDNVYNLGKKDLTFALTRQTKYLESMLLTDSEEFSIDYYDSIEECLEAVIDGKADIVIQDTYVMNYMIQKPAYADVLTECPGDQLKTSICILASKENQMLVTILNKTINYISEEEEEDINTRGLWMNLYERTFTDVLYEYRFLFMGILLSIILGGCVYTVLLQRMTNLRIEKKEYEILQKQVQQDELTGVYNRKYFYVKAKEMIDNTEEAMCIVMMDIINFKVVNDLYGMEIGDRLLRHMAQNLLEMGKERKFIVSRFNGDHFYMCMRNSDFQEIHFPKRFKTFLEDMDIKVVYGVFPIEGHKDVPLNIMCDRASIAVHDKERKRVEYIRYYSDEERKRIIQEQEIENEMEKALETRQFCAYVQPKYDVYQEKIIGGEALVRWIHPQKGMIPPGVFISLFEKNGFILRLDYFVWEEACRLLSEMKKQGVKTCPISINVSRVHFYGKELRDKLEELIAKYQLSAKDLQLEITETICAEDPEIIYKRIKELQDSGFKVAMDDFGSGYSSLNMLKEMPLDIIKMDLKFLDGGDDIEKSHNILQTLISLAHSLNLEVIVEGVETEAQVEFLRDIGNRYVQGYYFSKPVTGENYVEMVKQEQE